MRDIHPNEISRLVHTVETMNNKMVRLERAIFEQNNVEQEAPKAAVVEDDRMTKLTETVAQLGRDFTGLKMRVGDVSSRLTSTNDKANALRKDVDKMSKLLEAMRKVEESKTE